MQPLHAMPGIGHFTTPTMTDFEGTLGDTLWREGGVCSVLVPAGAGMAVELRSLLAASRLLLSRVLPTTVSRSPTAPPA